MFETISVYNRSLAQKLAEEDNCETETMQQGYECAGILIRIEEARIEAIEDALQYFTERYRLAPYDSEMWSHARECYTEATKNLGHARDMASRRNLQRTRFYANYALEWVAEMRRHALPLTANEEPEKDLL